MRIFHPVVVDLEEEDQLQVTIDPSGAAVHTSPCVSPDGLREGVWIHLKPAHIGALRTTLRHLEAIAGVEVGEALAATLRNLAEGGQNS